MIVTGIPDEAAEDLATQVEVHRELGWSTVELRSIDGKNIAQIDEDSFERACDLLERENMEVIAFASPIANWSRAVTGDFSLDVEDLKRSAPRMQRLKTRYIRVMSYPNDGLDEKDWRDEVFKRMRELAGIAEGEGIVLVHENCDGWGSQSPENLQALMEEINSPALQVVFDSGNPLAHCGTAEDTWHFYRAAKPFIRHFHIKDCRLDEQGQPIHTFPGEGWCMVKEIIRDLLASGYPGAFYIEPHMAVQIHLGTKASEHSKARSLYLEYGKRAVMMLEGLAWFVQNSHMRKNSPNF